jgi:AraC-like DNA-binding protein
MDWGSKEQVGRFRDGFAGRAFHRAIESFEGDIREHRHWELIDVVTPSVALRLGNTEILGILPNRPPWNRLCSWIVEHLQQRILVDQMAEHVNMSPRNFARVFRREFHIPPGEFLDRVRVAAAVSDLEEGAQSIEQIAFAHGFRSGSTMRRAFLRVLGVTPSEYRDRVCFHCDGTAQPPASLAAFDESSFPLDYTDAPLARLSRVYGAENETDSGVTW